MSDENMVEEVVVHTHTRLMVSHTGFRDPGAR
jgi:hypothetical protein